MGYSSEDEAWWSGGSSPSVTTPPVRQQAGHGDAPTYTSSWSPLGGPGGQTVGSPDPFDVVPAPRRSSELTSPWPSDRPDEARLAPPRITGTLLVVPAIAAVIGVLALLFMLGVFDQDSTPRPAPEPAPTALPVVGAIGSCTVAGGFDAAGTSYSYEGARAVDGDRSTAWRCRGNGTGERLVLDLGATRTVTEVGLVPGFDKVDPYDGTDRWVQSPRITAVSWTFDDGRRVVQTFDGGVGEASRRMQTVAVAPTASRTVTITVLATTPGRTVAGRGPAALTGFSEATVVGR